jgi:hypothetical protein
MAAAATMAAVTEAAAMNQLGAVTTVAAHQPFQQRSKHVIGSGVRDANTQLTSEGRSALQQLHLQQLLYVLHTYRVGNFKPTLKSR